jgi:hypothetical protein
VAGRFATEEEAEAWIAGSEAAATMKGEQGDCIVLNAWSADMPEAHRVLHAGGSDVRQFHRDAQSLVVWGRRIGVIGKPGRSPARTDFDQLLFG